MSAAITNCQNPLNRIAGAEGFKDKNVLITGGSSFLGKVLIEKLLRTCPLVNKIYIIMRIKNEKDPRDSLKDIFDEPLYNLLKQTQGEAILMKVIPIPGDLMETDLRLPSADRELLTKEVQIIFHLAATTRCDEPSKRAVLLNTRGTQFMLEFAKECKQLLVFLHCSTMFCFPKEKILYEQTYKPPENPEIIISMFHMFNDDVIDVMGKILMRNYGTNTYVYSKALAEDVVAKEMDNLPVLIVRPSIVAPIWRDPLPGWTDSIYSPTGLLIALGKGMLRTTHCDPEGFADFVPVDTVANAFILSVWTFMKNRNVKIYNLTNTGDLKITWVEFMKTVIGVTGDKMPFNRAIWYPGVSMIPFKFLHQTCVILFHYIPAILLDAFIGLVGNKRVLWKMQQKITNGLELFGFYSSRQWEFNNQEERKIKQEMNDTEQKIYKLDKADLDLNNYIYNCAHEARLRLLKKGDETLLTARIQIKIMWTLDRICKTLLVLGILSFLFKYIINPVLNIK